MCNFVHNVLSQKTMFKVSNRNTRKRCLLISKITLKTSERRHLTTSCLSEAFVPRIYTNFQSKVCFQFCFQIRRPVISTIVNPFMSLYDKSLLKYFIYENSKCQCFLFLKKQPQKWTNLIFKGPTFQYHKVRHLNFQ